MYSLYCHKADDFPGTYDAWLDLLHPEDIKRTKQALQDAIDGIKGYEHEFRILLPGGNVKLIKDQAGDAVKLIGTDWDNVEQREAQRQLKFANAAINNSQNIFFWVNNLGVVVDINGYACQILQYSREEVLGQNIWIFDENCSAETWAEKWEGLKKDTTWTFESNYQRKDGSTFPVDVTASYLLVDDDEYCFLHGHDITKRKASEEKNSIISIL